MGIITKNTKHLWYVMQLYNNNSVTTSVVNLY